MKVVVVGDPLLVVVGSESGKWKVEGGVIVMLVDVGR